MIHLVHQLIAASPTDKLRIQESPKELGIPTVYFGGGIQAIISTVGFIGGVLAVAFIIVGGIKYASSNGDSSRVANAKNTIQYAVIGLVISILAPLIVSFVISKGPS